MQGRPALRHTPTAPGSRAPSKWPWSSDSGLPAPRGTRLLDSGTARGFAGHDLGPLAFLADVRQQAGQLCRRPAWRPGSGTQTCQSPSVRLLLGALAKSLQERAVTEPELMPSLTLQPPGAREAGRASATHGSGSAGDVSTAPRTAGQGRGLCARLASSCGACLFSGPQFPDILSARRCHGMPSRRSSSG